MAHKATKESEANVFPNDSVICTFYDAQVFAEGDFIIRREITMMMRSFNRTFVQVQVQSGY